MFPVIKIAIFSEISDYRYSTIFKKSLLKKKKLPHVKFVVAFILNLIELLTTMLLLFRLRLLY